MYRARLRTALSGLLTLGLAAATAAAAAQAQTPPPSATPPTRAGGPANPAMRLTTPAWPDGADIPVKYTQAGEQISPELNWTNAPADTASFVLLMHDPDVAINNTTDDQLHWLVWNIPSSAKGLPEHVPQGAQRPDGSYQVSASGPVYRGPGAGAAGPKHHYTIEVFALDAMLSIQPAATWQETRANVVRAMQGHVRGKAVYVGLFHRPQ